MEYLIPTLDVSSNVSPLLKRKVENGELGVKTGKGFYEWTPASVDALRARISKSLAEIAQST
jgi:3-hydroxybutyryl-CoA dehydrogenase